MIFTHKKRRYTENDLMLQGEARGIPEDEIRLRITYLKQWGLTELKPWFFIKKLVYIPYKGKLWLANQLGKSVGLTPGGFLKRLKRCPYHTLMAQTVAPKHTAKKYQIEGEWLSLQEIWERSDVDCKETLRYRVRVGSRTWEEINTPPWTFEMSSKNRRGKASHLRKDAVLKHIGVLQSEVFGIMKRNGWWPDFEECETDEEMDAARSKFPVAENLLAIHGEVSEAYEAARRDLDARDIHIPAHSAFSVELADIVIATLNLAEASGVELGQVILDKMNSLRKRGYRHGNKRF